MTAHTPADGTGAVVPLVRPAPVQLHLPPGSLVLAAGLPGAGKTTLVRRLADADRVHALDSEDIARALARVPLPYRLLRPLVHTAHLARVVVALWSTHPRVLTSDPLTSPLRRRLLRTAARLSGRQLHVVLVHASPAQARDGQQRRGRRLSRRRMTRHEARYGQWLRTALGSDVDVALSRQDAAAAVLAPEPDPSPALAATAQRSRTRGPGAPSRATEAAQYGRAGERRDPVGCGRSGQDRREGRRGLRRGGRRTGGRGGVPLRAAGA